MLDNSMKQLSFQEVSFAYEGTQKNVLSNFSFDVEKNDIVAILGPNGAGKTTMLNLAMGLYQPLKGNIFLNEKKLQNYERRFVGEQIALVPQSENVNFEFTVREYLLIGRTPYMNFLGTPKKEDYDCVDTMLKKVEIDHLAHKYVTTLSGGEFQLILLARALTQEPSILLLDEPTSHLDLANKSHLVKIIRTLQQSGMAVLLTTHDPQMAYRLATKVILMKDGKIFKVGSPRDILTTKYLSETYEVQVQVQRANGQLYFVW